ncbi:alpha-glucuronidase [Bacteroides sp. HF-5092]|uniref:alpha-glucuronidase family glycosyl hydrolase n=1 Tax=Bacteroides TaxID=816 RepID=UPI0011778A84|nr:MULTISPECIES: alpha-glucuronidase family glycosyl hydrolase [Bacteroides]TRX44158.1 alpha-glucuronidase [Bacteroides sp. HF-5092]
MRIISILILVFLFCFPSVYAEDGSALWLRYPTGAKAIIMNKKQSPTLNIAVSELQNFWQGGIPITLEIQKNKELRALGNDGYIIRASKDGNHLTITSSGEQGILYGTYHLLRLQATGQLSESTLKSLNVSEKPDYRIRILNHWDNLDGTIERGYAGHSLWKWDELPSVVFHRYEAYARANASIGINATVINNVNASPKILSDDYLRKVKVLADIFRPYGLKIYLSINFSSPAALGGLSTSDPLDKEVIAWWKKKAKDIYSLIPDFGGFLVKANSEGQPGPCDYGRTHAEGANMLADVLKPYHGIVMWRAFVYSPTDSDRAKQAYLEFEPLDGKFRDNVIVQIKNGPIDFQPREPFSPLFGAMKKTAVMPEFQITQEYLGFSNHLAFLAPMWKECLDSDTYMQGEGSTIARVTDGSLFPHSLTAIAGVTNIGDDTNWCGHPFAQANWYAFGRLAWKHSLSSEQIGEEWLRQTFLPVVDTQSNLLTGEVAQKEKEQLFSQLSLLNSQVLQKSREAVVNYMMPLGLHHIFAWGHHYGPEPWCDIPNARPDWMPSYYHRADSLGIGFDRSSTGSNATGQYHSPLCERLDNVDTCPENMLLWFHHVSWNHQMKNGRTLWTEMCYAYDRGVKEVRNFQKVWDSMQPYIDSERFQEVQHRLKIQARDAVWWRDACLLYFGQFSKQPIPYELERPVHELKDMMEYQLDMTNFECPPYGFTK